MEFLIQDDTIAMMYGALVLIHKTAAGVAEYGESKENAIAEIERMARVATQEFTARKERFGTIWDLAIKVRTWNCLKNAGIEYISEVIERTPRDFLRMKNFGKGCLRDLESALDQMDLSLRQ